MSNSTSTMGPQSKSPFDLLEEYGVSLSPYFTIPTLEDLDDADEKHLTWHKNSIKVCETYYKDYFHVQMDNLLLFKGIQWLNQDRYSNRFLDRQGVVTRKSPRVVINHLYDFVEQWVSRLTRYRPAVAIYPTNTEYQDEQDARTSKSVLDHIWYTNNIESYLQEFARQAKVYGEAFLYINWDPKKGDLHPDFLEIRKQAQAKGQMTIPRKGLVDQNGNPIVSEQGDEIKTQTAVRIGDLSYKVAAPWHWYEQPCSNRDDIDWCYYWETKDVAELRTKYPEKADKIKSNTSNEVFDNYRLDIGKMKNEVVVYHFYHRHSEFLERGRYVKMTKDCILENVELPFSHGKLPYVKMTDIDVPDQIRGMSFFQQLYPLQHQINACASLIYKSLVLFSHPKFVIPDGACEIQNLLNDSTVVSYQGGVAPTLLSQSAVSSELFNYLNKLEATAEKLSGIFTMSRGQAPQGVRAAKALRVLEEQEDKRGYILNSKFNMYGLVENAKMTLSVAGDYYDDTDGRLARVVGSDNEYDLVSFKTANLSKSYDIRIENTTALSQSPAARLEELNEMANVRLAPDSIITREQYINFSDLGRSDEFKDIATRAVRAAKAETQKILSGEQVPEPTPEEDLINHWKVHIQPMQGLDFKMRVPEQLKVELKKHVYLTEGLMFEKAFGGVINPTTMMPEQAPNEMFKQRLMMECGDWPIFFKLPPGYSLMPMPMEPQPNSTMSKEGSANTVSPTGNVPPAPL